MLFIKQIKAVNIAINAPVTGKTLAVDVCIKLNDGADSVLSKYF